MQEFEPSHCERDSAVGFLHVSEVGNAAACCNISQAACNHLQASHLDGLDSLHQFCCTAEHPDDPDDFSIGADVQQSLERGCFGFALPAMSVAADT